MHYQNSHLATSIVLIKYIKIVNKSVVAMMDDETGKLIVVNKIVREYCVSVILQNLYIKMYYIMYCNCIMLFTRLYLLYPC